MMKLTELQKKHPNQMSKEELEQDMLDCLASMNETLDKIDARAEQENATDRNRNHQFL